jgi:Large polyvalent protein-associated domain 7
MPEPDKPNVRRQPLPVNSIGIDAPRERASSRVAPEGTQQETEGPQGATEAAGGVPEHIRPRYIQVGNRFHFPDGDPAFQLRKNRITTRSENPQVIRDMLEIEEARSGGAPLRVRGSENFRKEAWMQAQLLNIEVRGYRPTEVERTQVARLLAQQRRGAQDIAASKSPDVPDQAESLPLTDPGAAQRPTRELAPPDEGRIYRGRLAGHGAAPYQYDPGAQMSYYVRLETPSGERRTLWGKDFERSIKESLSRVKLGDEVSIQRVGERPVTVTARRRDEDGNLVRRQEITAYRNRWLVERQDFLREREELARVVRDATIDPHVAVEKHPNLVGTYLELQAAKLAARELYQHEEDRERFITRFRDSVADEIARGERFSVPRVKTSAARERAGKGASRDPRERVQERVIG